MGQAGQVGLCAEETSDLRAAVGARRHEWERQRRLSPPLVLGKPLGARLIARATDAMRVPVPGIAAAGEDGLEVLTGMPASPGRATGPVRVIRGPDDFARFRPGEVLVAQVTAPAWTPLFGRAGGAAPAGACRGHARSGSGCGAAHVHRRAAGHRLPDDDQAAICGGRPRYRRRAGAGTGLECVIVVAVVALADTNGGNVNAHNMMRTPMRMRTNELNDLDLSSAPLLSRPWDPLQLAAQAWMHRHNDVR